MQRLSNLSRSDRQSALTEGGCVAWGAKRDDAGSRMVSVENTRPVERSGRQGALFTVLETHSVPHNPSYGQNPDDGEDYSDRKYTRVTFG